MSPAAYVHVRNVLNDFGEMIGIFANGATVDDISIACCNYAQGAGWINNTAGSPSGWIWYGNSCVSPIEDFLFGFHSHPTGG